MVRFTERNRVKKNKVLIIPSLNLVLYIVIALILLSAQNAYAVISTFSGGRMLNLAWSAPESGADHYRLEVTETDLMNESAVGSIYHAYTKSNFYQIELEEGSSYTIRIQSVNSYGVFSGYSEVTTFVLRNGVITSMLETSNDKTPADFSLSQNYPNPFNPMTVITYSLPGDSHVKLVIYNISGQKVTELQNNIIKAGTHSVVWDAGGMPSGTYFYMIKTDKFTHSRKMLLLK